MPVITISRQFGAGGKTLNMSKLNIDRAVDLICTLVER
jgi:hypothetical protein